MKEMIDKVTPLQQKMSFDTTNRMGACRVLNYQFVPPLVLMSLLLKDLDNFLTLLSIDVSLEYNWGFVEAAQFRP